MHMMVKVTVRMLYRDNEGQLREVDQPLVKESYFPTYAAALILMRRWQTEKYTYAPLKIEEVPDNPELYHADVNHYRHLWEGKR